MKWWSASVLDLIPSTATPQFLPRQHEIPGTNEFDGGVPDSAATRSAERCVLRTEYLCRLSSDSGNGEHPMATCVNGAADSTLGNPPEKLYQRPAESTTRLGWRTLLVPVNLCSPQSHGSLRKALTLVVGDTVRHCEGGAPPCPVCTDGREQGLAHFFITSCPARK